tara:strand:- start:324 stop:440 length:117 start_codon:yes stop_codon:yes gene_type:complete
MKDQMALFEKYKDFINANPSLLEDLSQLTPDLQSQIDD